MAKSSAVVSPNLGLYYNRAPIALEPGMLRDGINFRVKEGKLNNLNLGWERFEPDITLNGPVTLIDQFFIRGLDERIIFGTLTDLYVYDPSDHAAYFITPIYATGTASASGTAVTGVGSLWNTADNVKVGDWISFGSATQNDPAAQWYQIKTVNSNTSLTLEASAGTKVDGPYTIRKTFTGSLLDIWSSDIFVNSADDGKDWWFVTNGIDPIIRWDGQTQFVEIAPGLTTIRAVALAAFSNMMIYANITQGGERLPSTIINSDVGDPNDISSGLSEQFKVHSGTDGIVNIAPLGDNLAIYSFGHITIAQFLGDPLIFSFRQAVNGVGAVAYRTVSDFGDYHEFLGNDVQYVFDGVTLKETGSQVFREVLRQQDPARVTFAYTHFDEENGDLIWSVPSTADPDSGNQDAPPSLAWVEHYLEDVPEGYNSPISKREFPFTATGYYERKDGLTWDQLTDTWANLNFRWNDQFFFVAFPFNLAGDYDGKLYFINTVQNKPDGSGLNSFVRFGRRALGDGRMRGLLSRVYPFAAQFATALSVTSLLTDNAHGPITTTQVDTFDQTLPEGGHFVSPYRRGRFMELQFGTPGPNMPYEIAGYDLDVKPGGQR